MYDGYDDSILEEMVRVMKKVNIYIFCSQKQIPKLLNFFLNHRKDKEHILYRRKINWNLISWHKANPTPSCNNKYLSDTEYILFFRERGVEVYGTYETKKTYYVTKSNVKDKRAYNHPTPKLVSMVENFIINSSNENDVVLDPFMGSGTTGVASLNTKRRFIGIEINDDYFNTARDRIEKSSYNLMSMIDEG